MTHQNDDTEHLGAEQDDISGAVLIDVRRSPAFGQSQHLLPGALWQDPDAIAGVCSGYIPIPERGGHGRV